MFEHGWHESETLKAALCQWELEWGESSGYERARRRVAAPRPPLKCRRWMAWQSLRLTAALGRAQLRVVLWLVVPLALLTAASAAPVARLFNVAMGPSAAVRGFVSLVLFDTNLTVTMVLSRIRQDAVALATLLGPSAVVLTRVAVVLVLDVAIGLLGTAAAATWGTIDVFGLTLVG